MQITVLDDYQDAVRKLDCAQHLAGHDLKIFNNTVKGVGQLSVRLRDAQAVVLIRERTALSRQLLEKCPKLQLVVQTGRIGPHVDVQACTDLGIAVAQGQTDPAVTAELTWALVLAAARRLPQYIASLKHGAWQQAGLKSQSMPPNFGLGQRLAGKTLGIWGYGRIGQQVARYAQAFDMRVQVWGSEASRARAVEHGFAAAPSREALFATSDVLSLHLRLSESTRHLITLADLSLMRPTSILVNTARPELLVPDALVAALNRGRPGLAAVDVFEAEPILQGHPLLRLENAICTPHIGFVELQHYEYLFSQAFDTVRKFAAGDLSDVINAQGLSLRRV
ncbi:D-2-hydroxyacid dehydrogenase family protein [Thiomonas sp.]|jgi:D-3-phosphoglycerate dehydrogenase|uniref:D-2-hydroxyacid dehydrogenase family protein n=1 Tax=Thiomonas sp. TaxID=2047785 RepID=UPI00262ABCE9|nr:D-2-hydroxyacid dehydrogenase family protein [Thiomonas sp.]